jgi:hypothetical protein
MGKGKKTGWGWQGVEEEFSAHSGGDSTNGLFAKNSQNNLLYSTGK